MMRRMLRSTGWLGGALLIFSASCSGPGASRAGEREPAAAQVPTAPTPLTEAGCVKAVFPAAQGARISAAEDADEIAATEVIELSPDVTICRVDHKQPASKHITVEVAAVQRATRAVLGKQTLDIEVGSDPSGMGNEDAVAVTLLPLTTRETAVQIEQTTRLTGPMLDDGTTRTTLYRIAAAGLVPIFSFESTWAAGEADSADRCELRDVTPAAALPSQLVLDCEKTTSSWHDPDPADRGTRSTRRTETYRWTGTRYERKSP